VGNSRASSFGKIGFNVVLPGTAVNFRDDLMGFKNAFLYHFPIVQN
jgi:hypothetical protein